MAEEGLYSIAPGETPQAVSSRRKIAEALLAEGMSTKPIQAWTQGAANLAKALIGGYGIGSADADDARGLQRSIKNYSATFGDEGPPAPDTSPSSVASSLAGRPTPGGASTGVSLPPGVPARDVSLGDLQPISPAGRRSALTGPNAQPVPKSFDGFMRPPGAIPAEPPPDATTAQASAPQGAPQPSAQPRRPDSRLIASLLDPYLPKPLQELGMARAKEQQKPPEYKHFTSGDKNFVFDPNKPSDVRELGPNSENKFGNVAELRKEIQRLPAYENWTKRVEPTYRSMLDTQHTDSKASDVNIVYGLATILDPGSVVRDGEQIMIQKTASLPDWVVGQINGLNGGSRLTPETRKAIIAEATSRARQHYDALKNDISPYSGIAQNFGMRPEHVLPAIRSFPEGKAPPGAMPPAAASPAAAVKPAPVRVNSPLEASKLPPKTPITFIDPRTGQLTQGITP